MIAGFELGCRAPFAVRHERVGSRRGAAWRLLYASDLHLTERRAFLVAQLVAAAHRERPHTVLLGGDLVDRANGLPILADAVRALAATAPVAVVAGNHDAWFGIERVRTAIASGGGHWLADEDLTLSLAGLLTLHLHAAPRARDRGYGDRSCTSLRALVGHHPSIGEAAAAHAYDVAFAGHLHGGQCEWWQRGGRSYPGAWFSRWNGPRFALDRTTLLVSRGVADTLPVRFRCPREVICCELAGATP